MNVTRTLVRTLTRSATKNGASKEVNAPPAHLKDKYRHFQIDNNLLVHQRGGTTDYVMFVITVAVNAVGLIMAGDLYYKMYFKK